VIVAELMATESSVLDRQAVSEWYRRNRQRSRQLFELLKPEAYYSRPIALRNPIVFYEGHLPAFTLNTLVKKGLGRPGVDARLERLFARGIDPDSESSADGAQPEAWPTRDEVLRFADACDAIVLDALANAPLEQAGHPLLDRAQAVYAVLEHEAMHQETLVYMWHQLPYDHKVCGKAKTAFEAHAHPVPSKVAIPAGRVTLGAHPEAIRFGWDNEFPAARAEVPAFQIDVHNVTNEQFADFVSAGGYRDDRWWTPDAYAWVQEQRLAHPQFWVRRHGTWKWRGMFEERDLPAAWPVYVSQAEAAAYARWRNRRLPTEAEYHRAAFGDPSGTERQFPWGDAPPDASRGHFDFASWNPVGVGTFPAGQSAWGVHDLMGNGWEWTSSYFSPFPGFRPLPSYPEYSADFYDGNHVVMKGASPATAAELLRPSFRNWFRPHYPYVYATFRCVKTTE
jgi:iron(II)-dependent oxidoreductase